MVLPVDGGEVKVEVELAEVGRHADDLLAGDELFALPAKLDELLDGAELEFVFFREAAQLREAGHRAVVVHDLTYDAHRPAAGETGEVHRRLCVAGALEDAAGFGAKRKDVAWLHEILGKRSGVGQNFNRLRTVGGADASGDALRGIDADLEIGAMAFAVVEHHALDTELLQAFRCGGTRGY